MESGVIDAMCKGNGRPRMHCQRKVGLSVEYWKERRKMPPSTSMGTRARDTTTGGAEEGIEEDMGKTWRVILEIDELSNECSSLDTVRTSEHWVSQNIVKPRYSGFPPPPFQLLP